MANPLGHIYCPLTVVSSNPSTYHVIRTTQECAGIVKIRTCCFGCLYSSSTASLWCGVHDCEGRSDQDEFSDHVKNRMTVMKVADQLPKRITENLLVSAINLNDCTFRTVYPHIKLGQPLANITDGLGSCQVRWQCWDDGQSHIRNHRDSVTTLNIVLAHLHQLNSTDPFPRVRCAVQIKGWI